MTERQGAAKNDADGSGMEGLLLAASDKLSDITAKAQQVSSVVDELADAQRQCAASLAEMQNRASQMAALATEALAAKTQIADYQAVIATKSDHIEQAQIHADKVRADMDRELTSAKQQSTDAEAFKARAQSAADSTAEALMGAKTARATAEIESKAITELSVEAKVATESLQGLAARAAAVDERIAAYEDELRALKERSEAQLATIVSLLPGATSAGFPNLKVSESDWALRQSKTALALR